MEFNPLDAFIKPSSQRYNFMDELLPMLQAKAKEGAGRLGGFLQENVVSPVTDFVNPLDQKFGISQMFGNVSNLYKGITQGSKHLGLDLKTPEGTAVKAPISGRVVVGNDPKGFGQYVQVIGDDGTTHQFSHLSGIERLGDRVNAGQVIGKTGGRKGSAGAGNTTGAHLDLSVKRGGQFVDPMTLEMYKRWLGGDTNG